MPSVFFVFGALFAAAASTPAGATGLSEGFVVVTGATGQTGSLVYNQLKSKHLPVRALVRNVTKAREYLGCSKCDESEGIFVGDVTEPDTLVEPMKGAASLVIASSAAPICTPYPTCHFPKGGSPIDVDWHGAKAVLEAFAKATVANGLGHVVLISTMGTTAPEDAKDPFEHIGFYKLNFEAELMSSGLPFTIVKPCGLLNTPPSTTELIVGHDDDLTVTPPTIARADVARVCVAAVQQPLLSAKLRFDLCSKAGTPTSEADLAKVLQAARYPWETKDGSIMV